MYGTRRRVSIVLGTSVSVLSGFVVVVVVYELCVRISRLLIMF